METKPYLISLDPGSTQTGLCIIRKEDMMPVIAAKLNNEAIFDAISNQLYKIGAKYADCDAVIERIAGTFMNNFSAVYVTCEWVGIFKYEFMARGILPSFVYRPEEYKALCGNIYPRNDKGIRNALVDRFAYGQKNYGKGSKSNPGWFYGFSADSWAAYAVAVTHMDMGDTTRSWKVGE